MMFSLSKIGLYFFTFISIYWTLVQTVDAQELTLKPQLNIPKELAQQVISIKARARNESALYLLTQKGEIALVTAENTSPITLIDITNQYPNLLSATAFTVKPSNPTTEETNSRTFYSAHIEPSNAELRTARITLDKTQQPFELVLTEWQTKLNLAETANHRELFRVPVPNKNIEINQIDFSPYTKSWQEDFGQLFIGMTGEEDASQSHFSGTVLRIIPYKYGFKQYTSVSDNPFISDSNIIDEAIMVGAGKLQQFFWTKGKAEQLFIHTKHQNEALLTKINYGDNRLNIDAGANYAIADLSASIVFSRYNDEPLLKNRFAYLSVENNLWQLNGIDLLGKDKNIHKVKELPLLSQKNDASVAPPPLLTYTHSNRLIILDRKTGNISELQNTTSEAEPITPDLNESSNTSVIWVLFLVSSLGAMLFLIRKKSPQHQYKTAKKLLHNHFGKFEVDGKQRTIRLFKRHQTTAELIIPFNELKQLAITLNNKTLCEVSAEQPFSNQLEQKTNDLFALEKRNKMIEGYIRSITLNLSSKEGDEHIVYTYLRDGNQRLTKAKYDQVIVQLFDWCWLFSQTVAENNTESRIIKEKLQPVIRRKIQPTKAKQTPKEKAPVIKQPKLLSQEKPTEIAKSAVSTAKLAAESINEKTVQNTKADTSDSKVNLALVNALNDLVEMKKQGFLTEEEFKESKLKILQNLTSE